MVGHRLFGRFIRSRVAKHLKTDGFALIGKEPSTGLSDEQVKELLGHIDDDTVIAAATHLGAFGDGSIIASIEHFIQWISDHSEQIMAIVKFLLSILSVFGL